MYRGQLLDQHSGKGKLNQNTESKKTCIHGPCHFIFAFSLSVFCNNTVIVSCLVSLPVFPHVIVCHALDLYLSVKMATHVKYSFCLKVSAALVR